MIRTQISLDATEYELAKQQAASLGVTVAEFIRRAVRDKLRASDTRWMRFAGMVSSGNPNSSSSVDDVVYGLKTD